MRVKSLHTREGIIAKYEVLRRLCASADGECASAMLSKSRLDAKIVHSALARFRDEGLVESDSSNDMGESIYRVTSTGWTALERYDGYVE